MTDNEIIKALECCIKGDVCENCPYFTRRQRYECGEHFSKDALDLINRQKAEIERLNRILNTDVVVFRGGRGNGKSETIRKIIEARVAEIRAKAVKEFAERLNKEAENVGIDREGDFLYSDSDNTAFEIYNTVAEWCNEVANTILKEMVGDKE